MYVKEKVEYGALGSLKMSNSAKSNSSLVCRGIPEIQKTMTREKNYLETYVKVCNFKKANKTKNSI